MSMTALFAIDKLQIWTIQQFDEWGLTFNGELCFNVVLIQDLEFKKIIWDISYEINPAEMKVRKRY